MTKNALKPDWFNVRGHLNSRPIPTFRQNDGTRLAVVKSDKLRVDAVFEFYHEDTPFGKILRAKDVIATITY